MIEEKIKKDIKLHALIDSPRECCGFIVYNAEKQRQEIFRCRNIASNSIDFVQIDSREYLFAKEVGEILYFYHSHKTKPKLSDFDSQQKEFNELNYIVYVIETDEFVGIDKQSKYIKYTNIPFKIGKSDCYNLVQDFYKNELNIVLPNIFPDRKQNWLKESKDFIKENIKNSNFFIVGDRSLNKFDLIVMDFSNNQWHFGVYLDDNLILHHNFKKKSSIDNYDENYKKITKYVLRPYDINR